MQKYLVTGGEGFIGNEIAKATNAIPFDLKSGEDILDIEKLKLACSEINGIFHCAAKISVSESIQKPDEYKRTNVQGTASVIEAVLERKTKIIFSSSAAVYGVLNFSAEENLPLHPLSPYAENKCDAEKLLQESGIPSIVLRYFNVYGPGQSASYAGVITTFIQHALRNEDILIYGDGEQVRDFIYVDDVVQANVVAMESNCTSGDVFNIGSGIVTSINQLAEEIIRLSNSSSIIKKNPARSGDIVYSQANIIKAKEMLGWNPKVSLQEGLKKTLEYYKALN